MSHKHLPADGAESRNRVFKTSWFVRAARKAGISDKELCKALGEVQQGKCDDLGGGVFKSVWARTPIGQSFSPKENAGGFTPTCLQKRTARTLTMPSLPPSSGSPRFTG
jgi:hypothetical protein